ncbi:hypothetical protein A1O7_07272 [Cladophialophora yegresii CBS 114405]|uniref:DUF7626 domain-containing protein n=1 Tax=Cladophialophora yegresii CBS 114405 TaxID=1182544 RepID=W9VN25_9EURO|nr:uncharacterized protein A1O7_07272 [Cladophialophora yegresii CBS 114405]EXJ56928.1 hypothetical protein A1O7_07272 [Cladophialophora yegresii CBS 114405]
MSFSPSIPRDSADADGGGSDHNRLPFQDLSFRGNTPTEPSVKVAPPLVFRQSTHRLPYFAHQQLDLDYFPLTVGRPVGGPIVEGEESDQGWDDEDSQGGADLESDADDDLYPDKPRRRRKFESSKIANAAELKKMKIQGGRPAIAKKVTADLDSDDELIVRMKEARYLEKDIAKALVDQGRTAYNPKTIGTRWRRLKAALQKRQDDLLDADLTDWHEGDDDVLLQAVVKTDKEVKRLKEEIEAKKWRMVADQPVVNFSQNACRERYEALQAGTAKPTPESIETPSEEILERIRSRKDKERKIAESTQYSALEQKNVEANAWTSRMRTYF